MKKIWIVCVIFPKGKTTWEGFVPPCQFKDGDVISNGYCIAIFYKLGTPEHCSSPDVVYYHCYYKQKYCEFKAKLDFGIGTSKEFRYATEEEKQKLFDAIKDNGYKWNSETKTLDKLVEPKFNIGDKVKHKCDKNNTVITITGSKNDYYYIQYYNNIKNEYQNEKISFTDQDKYELIIDKFDINTLIPFESRV